MEQKLAEYFFLYKELSKLHKAFNFGETPHSSSGFTEKLCCYLLKLEKAEGVNREYDLFNPSKPDETFEVKGTTSQEGATTINPFSKFTFLLWVYIDQANNKVVIKKIKYQSMSKFFSKFKDMEKDKGRRQRISLKDYQHESINEYIFTNLKKITPNSSS